MPKVLLILISILLQSINFLWTPTQTFAANCNISIDPPILIESVPPLSDSVPPANRFVSFKINIPSTTTDKFKIVFHAEGWIGLGEKTIDNLTIDQSDNYLKDSGGGIPAFQFMGEGKDFLKPGPHTFHVEKVGTQGKYCDDYTYNVIPDPSGGIKECVLNFNPPELDENSNIVVTGKILPTVTPLKYKLNISSLGTKELNLDGSGNISPLTLGKINPINYQITLLKPNVEFQCKLVPGLFVPQCGPEIVYKNTNCQYALSIALAGKKGSVSQVGQAGPPPPGGFGLNGKSSAGKSCDYNLPIGKFGPTGTQKGIETAIGCIPTKPRDLIVATLVLGQGIGGGIAFLIMLFGAFQLITSAGNPDTVKAGHDKIINAVIGLLFIVFSVLLLQIIGQNILGIGGFGP